ncbi:NADH-quinone oxidoreductase subunit N [Chitinivorax tropicus]|uniref:NADH-quinone oxidoreductase subunit N n=2 Tax=Chitinivorax tropicus TaxID=714531 RepID=A0A840MJW4_9PROT|nr:NADH-quinone oxidoreductase subunit N [Chitinivorax tropicus]
MNLVAAAPELFLLCALAVILMVDVFVKDESSQVIFGLSLLTLAGCAFFTYSTLTPTVSYAFNNMFVDDPMADWLKLVIYVSVAAIFIYSRQYLQNRGIFKSEFFSLTLFSMLGMMVMVSANNLLVLYLGLELLSLSLYALVALQRDSAISTEAALKYFVLGALASGMLLYGMSMLYGATGSLDLQVIAEMIATGKARQGLLALGVVFVVAGLAFKLGAVPFHMWVPDVYQGAPTAITMFIGSAPKLAAFAFVIRLLVIAMSGLIKDWQPMLMLLAVASLAIGNITAIAQTSIKRMLAYSTISHMGFLLLGILSGSVVGYSASMFYAVAYVLMTLGAFGILLLLSGKEGEADALDTFKGLADRSKWYAFLMLLLMVSMAGIPGTIGFWAKLQVIQAVVDIKAYWLAITAVMFSLVGAFYYLRIIKLMYFDEADSTEAIGGTGDTHVLLSLNGVMILVLGIVPNALMSLCMEAIKHSVKLS